MKRSAKTRATILSAAIEEFAAQGFHDAKISNIVSRASVTQPAFYFYFPSKQEIYDHLLARVHDELLATIRAARVPSDVDEANFPNMLRAAIEAFLQYFSDNPLLARIGYFQSPISAAIREEVIAALSRHVAFEQGAGYLRRDLDPVFFTECYSGTLERVIQRFLLTGNGSPRDLALKVADIYLRGILAPEMRASATSGHSLKKRCASRQRRGLR
jgi:AcrR family transcriptional regulator